MIENELGLMQGEDREQEQDYKEMIKGCMYTPICKTTSMAKKS